MSFAARMSAGRRAQKKGAGNLGAGFASLGLGLATAWNPVMGGIAAGAGGIGIWKGLRQTNLGRKQIRAAKKLRKTQLAGRLAGKRAEAAKGGPVRVKSFTKTVNGKRIAVRGYIRRN